MRDPRAVMLMLSLFGCSSRNAVIADASIHLDGLSCVASGTCTTGVACGTTCCAAGEECVSGTCMCAAEPACSAGNICASGVERPDHCGEVCCGATGACPGIARAR